MPSKSFQVRSHSEMPKISSSLAVLLSLNRVGLRGNGMNGWGICDISRDNPRSDLKIYFTSLHAILQEKVSYL